MFARLGQARPRDQARNGGGLTGDYSLWSGGSTLNRVFLICALAAPTP